MVDWPRDIIPERNTDFEIPGALVARAQSGKVNTRSTTQCGLSWMEQYFLDVGANNDRKLLATARAWWRAGTSFDIVHRDYLTMKGTGGGTPLADISTTGAVSFTYVDGGAGADTITRAAGSFVADGIWAGMKIRVTGTTNNDGDYTVVSVVALTITLATGVLTAEGPVSSTITAVSTGSYLNVRGGPASTANWLRAGDIFTIAGITRVYEVTADAATDASGNVVLSIAPPIFTGGEPTDGAALTITGVKLRCVIAEPPEMPETGAEDFGVLRVVFTETLEAA